MPQIGSCTSPPTYEPLLMSASSCGDSRYSAGILVPLGSDGTSLLPMKAASSRAARNEGERVMNSRGSRKRLMLEPIVSLMRPRCFSTAMQTSTWWSV